MISVPRVSLETRQMTENIGIASRTPYQLAGLTVCSSGIGPKPEQASAIDEQRQGMISSPPDIVTGNLYASGSKSDELILL